MQRSEHEMNSPKRLGKKEKKRKGRRVEEWKTGREEK
jgi:hypothetical protein